MPKRIVPQTGRYILTRRSLNPSARILARALGLQKAYEPRPYPPAIRWGNSDGRYHFGDTTHNRSEIISIASNKLRFSNAMVQLGIPHVEILSGIPQKYPVVVRHNLSAARGIGIEVVTEYKEMFHSNVYWSYWRNFSIEFGVHILDGKIIKVFKKVAEEEHIYQGMDASEIEFEKSYPIRNASRGYGFLRVDIAKYPKLVPTVQNFCDKFGMSFGRIDIGWDADERRYVIIEANSAPGIAENENTASLYIEGFKTLLGRS